MTNPEYQIESTISQVGGGMNMNMMKQVQKMQQEMARMQEELGAKTYSAGAGVRPAGQQVRRLPDGRQNARLGDHVSHKIILSPKGQHRPVHSSLNHGGIAL